jgi:GAF domain-containing protein
MPNSPISRFRKEQILRRAGIDLAPYPTAAAGITTPEQDAQLLAAGTAWEQDVDKRYVEFLAQQLPDEGRDLEGAPGYVALCEAHGLVAALLALNRRVPHRYTAAYRLDGQRLRNVELIDKAGEVRPEFLAEVPLAESFCQFVLRQGKFVTSDSSLDSRLDGHPYKGVMMAYHGVPIMDSEGGLLGTLCHFDVESRPLADEELELMQAVGRRLHPFLPV